MKKLKIPTKKPAESTEGRLMFLQRIEGEGALLIRESGVRNDVDRQTMTAAAGQTQR